jgi:PPOX class probable F420-dependent enzyme
MPKPPIPDELQALLREPNPAAIATLTPDGAPHSVATWYLWEPDGRVLVNMDASRARLEYIRADARVSLTVLDAEDWYRHISLRGRVVSIEPDEGLEGIDRLSQHYRGQPYTTRDRPRVNAWVEVERWHAWGA